MIAVEKALWYIESHLGEEVTLGAVAIAAGVSPHHLVRAFGAVVGVPVMRHLRVRRLSQAAKALAQGAPDIFDVALMAGYGSHEAFTRAFRDTFGLTPESVRSRGIDNNLPLAEPIAMNEDLVTDLGTPRFETVGPLLLAGLSERYDEQASPGIPGQWQRFARHIGHIPGAKAGTTFGVCYNADDEGGIDYLTGVEVTDFGGVPDDLARLRIAAQSYAVFSYGGHVSTVRGVWKTIWAQWSSGWGRESADVPTFERYGPGFDPQSGSGGFEIWIPVTP